jgi:hypothetical protein
MEIVRSAVISGADIPTSVSDMNGASESFVLSSFSMRYLARKRIIDSNHEFSELND